VTTFTIPWRNDGAEELRITVDQDRPSNHQLEQRIRSAASMARSDGVLRLLLQSSVGEACVVTVGPTVAGVTEVDIRKA
jgi:hypothetical protein